MSGVWLRCSEPRRVHLVTWHCHTSSTVHVMRSRHAKVISYRDLTVWQRAMDLVDVAYEITKLFPKDERFSLTAQLQRSAVSVPSNIAEGHGRDHIGEYLHHLSIANGSLMELETQVLIASRRAYIVTADLERTLSSSRDVGRLLAGLIRALKRCPPRHLTPGTRHPTPDTRHLTPGTSLS